MQLYEVKDETLKSKTSCFTFKGMVPYDERNGTLRSKTTCFTLSGAVS